MSFTTGGCFQNSKAPISPVQNCCCTEMFTNFALRQTACETMIETLLLDPVVFSSDEAPYYLSGCKNRQNMRYWSDFNPRELHQKPLHSERENVRCTLSKVQIIGLYFLRRTIMLWQCTQSIISIYALIYALIICIKHICAFSIYSMLMASSSSRMEPREIWGRYFPNRLSSNRSALHGQDDCQIQPLKIFSCGATSSIVCITTVPEQ